MHSIAARFKHAGVFMALTVPFLTLSMASPAVAATPLATDSVSLATHRHCRGWYSPDVLHRISADSRQNAP